MSKANHTVQHGAAYHSELQNWFGTGREHEEYMLSTIGRFRINFRMRTERRLFKPPQAWRIAGLPLLSTGTHAVSGAARLKLQTAWLLDLLTTNTTKTTTIKHQQRQPSQKVGGRGASVASTTTTTEAANNNDGNEADNTEGKGDVMEEKEGEGGRRKKKKKKKTAYVKKEKEGEDNNEAENGSGGGGGGGVLLEAFSMLGRLSAEAAPLVCRELMVWLPACPV